MRTLVVSSFVTLDGVIQAPGGPDEDTSPSGVIIATYRRAGELRTGSFALDEPSNDEPARREGVAAGAP